MNIINLLLVVSLLLLLLLLLFIYLFIYILSKNYLIHQIVAQRNLYTVCMYW